MAQRTGSDRFTDITVRTARAETGVATTLRRTFGFDVLACPRCGGRLRLIALIEEAAVIERILGHLGVPTAVPAPRAARAPPVSADLLDATGWDDHAPVFDSGSWRGCAVAGPPARRRCGRWRGSAR